MGEYTTFAAMFEQSAHHQDLRRVRDLMDQGVNPLFAFLADQDAHDDQVVDSEPGTWQAA